jgi:hypothetical protein
VNHQDRERFAAVFEALAANFRAELGDGTIALTWSALADKLTIGELERAAARAVVESRFMPNVGELLELAGKGKRGPARKVQVIDGKPHTWLPGTGWGRYYGSIQDAQRSVGMEPTTSEELIKRIMPPAPPDRRLPREREDDDQ